MSLDTGVTVFTDTLEPLLRTSVSFSTRPNPIPGDLRPLWRIALLLAAFRACRGESATPQQLHALDWGARNESAGEALLAFLDGTSGGHLYQPIVRIDPAVTRAINFGIASGLMERDGAIRLHATTPGKQFLQEIEDSGDILVRERNFLSSLPKKLSQAHIDRLFDTRGIS